MGTARLSDFMVHAAQTDPSDAVAATYESRLAMTLFRQRSMMLPALLLFALAAAQGQQATTPPADPPTPITAQQAAVFQDALRALASQGHVAIIAEGAPLRSKLPPQDVPKLDDHWPLSAVVERVAAAYDYDSQRRGNVFVLKKRFSDPNDLPDVTPEECRQALDDVLGILAPFDPGQPDVSPARENLLLIHLADSLTPDQMEAMRQTEGVGGLPVASLNPEQQAMVRRFALTSYVHFPATDIRSVRAWLALMPTLTLRIKKERHVTTLTQNDNGRATTQTYVQNTAFGYEFLDSLHRPQFMPLEQGGAPDQGNILGSAQTWRQETIEPRPKLQDKLEGYTTLKTLIAAQNARGTRMKVDPALALKPVTVFGSETASPAEVISALADIYGLRVRKDADGTQRLTRLLFVVPSDLDAIPQSVRHSLPAPLLRAMHDGETEELRQQSQQLLHRYGGSFSSEAQYAEWQAQQQKIEKRGFDLLQISTTLRQVAVQRLRLALDAQLASQGVDVRAQRIKGMESSPVPLASLPQTARSAFAVVMMTDVLEAVIHTLGTQAPSWAARIDQDYLIGGLIPDPKRPGQQMFDLTVAGVRADGSLQPGTGTSTEYDP